MLPRPLGMVVGGKNVITEDDEDGEDEYRTLPGAPDVMCGNTDTGGHAPLGC
jgi:hypothetical protein